MLAPRKEKALLSRILWVVRTVVVGVLGLGLYLNWFGVDVEQLANVVTVLTAIVAVWALFDREFLRWILRQFRRAWDSVRGTRQVAQPPAAPALSPAPDVVDRPSDDFVDDVVAPAVGCVPVLVMIALIALLATASILGPRIWNWVVSLSLDGPETPRPRRRHLLLHRRSWSAP